MGSRKIKAVYANRVEKSHAGSGTQKDIDKKNNRPQYLGPEILPILEVGRCRDQGPKFATLARENRLRRKHASKEESGQKEKETLTRPMNSS
jgi:hypothetical protein